MHTPTAAFTAILSAIALSACRPVVPSNTCKAQISECLAKCDPAPDASGRIVMDTKQTSRATTTPCEEICMSASCSHAASPPSPAPAASMPTGAPASIPPDALSAPDGVTLPSPGAEADAGTPLGN